MIPALDSRTRYIVYAGNNRVWLCQISSGIPTWSELQKKVKTYAVQILLNDVDWQTSVGGMYYASFENDLPAGTTILSCSISGWGSIRSSDNVQPYIGTSRAGLMSNVKSFMTNAYVNVMLTYV